MNGERRARILAELAPGENGVVTGGRLCEVCRSVTGMSGAGIMLMSDDLALGSLCTTSAVSALIEELQYTLGEGPCVDAYQEGRPVLEPNLAEPATPRWLAFTGPAVAAGVRAVFGFPLAVDATRLGALDLYSDRPGPLSDEQHADALILADVAAEAVLAMQSTAPGNALAAGLQDDSNFHYVVHQAAGMVSVQLGVSVSQAIVRLRAYAFGHQRHVDEVAADVVDRSLRFDG